MDEQLVHVRPAEGMKVRDPQTLVPLPPEGLRVRMTTYWRRRIADGDAEIVGAGAGEEA